MLKKTIISLSIGAFLGLSAIPSFAAPIKLANSASGCTRYSGFSFSPQGAVTLKGCSKASRQATFTITPAATTIEKGKPLKVTISRTIGSGGKAGKDVLTLKSTGVAGTFSPATVTFNKGTTRKAVTVKFSAAGSAILSVMGGSGATLPPSAAIAVSSTKSCAGFTAPFTVVDLGQLSLTANTQDPANNRVMLGNGRAPTQMAFKLTIPSQTTIDTGNPYNVDHYFVVMETTSLAASHTRSFGVSQCVGEYQPTTTGCYVIGGPLLAWRNNLPDYECKVIPGESYYLNIMAMDNGVPLRNIDDGFVFKILPSPP